MNTKIIHPQGVCSKEMTIEYDDDLIIRNASVVGGCKGNLQGICRLIIGRKISDVVSTLEGVQCHNGTSCPDQLAKGLKDLL